MKLPQENSQGISFLGVCCPGLQFLATELLASQEIPYSDRGWPTFERAVSEMITPDGLVLDLALFVSGWLSSHAATIDRSCLRWEWSNLVDPVKWPKICLLTCFHATFFSPHPPLATPLPLLFSAPFRPLLPSKNALFCRAGAQQRTWRGEVSGRASPRGSVGEFLPEICAKPGQLTKQGF